MNDLLIKALDANLGLTQDAQLAELVSMVWMLIMSLALEYTFDCLLTID